MKQGMRFAVPAGFLCLVLSFAACAWAGAIDHDGGVFLRLSVGFGHGRTEFEGPEPNNDPGSTVPWEISGFTSDINFAIGGVVAPNLAVHATVFGWVAQGPDMTAGSQSEALRADVDITSIGAGVTYYAMPANVYFSGSAGLASLSISGSGGTIEFDRGWGLDFAVGKEWWVSDRWGLGVAGAVGYHSVPIKEMDTSAKGPSFGVRFTSTYN